MRTQYIKNNVDGLEQKQLTLSTPVIYTCEETIAVGLFFNCWCGHSFLHIHLQNILYLSYLEVEATKRR